jgi:hypothetical protein
MGSDHTAGDRTVIDIEAVAKYCTARQLEMVKAVAEHGSNNKAATALGISRRTVDKSVAKALAKAAAHGHSPAHDMVHTVPDNFVVKGVSTYYDAAGKPKAQWVKSNLQQEQYNDMLKDAIGEFLEDVAPIKVNPGPTVAQNDVIPWIQIGDAHVGMIAHAAETGEDFNLEVAERELCMAISILIDDLPPCERMVINDLGDGTHYDNFTATTAASGHALDADGRHPMMLRVYSRTMRFIVDKALEKAQHVDVIINQGNHSRINDFWMRELLTVAYGHTGRVIVLNNDSVFIGYRMGNTLVMVHHSDKCPPARLVGVMTTDYRKDFGETAHHYIDVGHVHHHFVSKEHPGVIIESWNHLAATDKWAHDAGYRSRKAITVVFRSKTYGDIGRRTLSIDEIKARIEKSGGAPVLKKQVIYSV